MYCRRWATIEEYIKTFGLLWRNKLTYLGHVTISENQSETPP